jgi:hypothetical protein
MKGVPKAEIYEKDGASRLSLSVVADKVLALRQPPKARKPRQEAVGAPARHETPFDDAVPF